MTEEKQLSDINLICKDCGENFVFTVNEQKFYIRQGFTNVPVRCKKCRENFHDRKYKGVKTYNIKCRQCDLVGKLTVEPPIPELIYCENCFNEQLALEVDKKGRLPISLSEAVQNLKASQS